VEPAPTARAATPDDLDAIAALTATSRSNLARWSRLWWRPAPGANALHRLWLQHLIGAEGHEARVVTTVDGRVVGCAFAGPAAGGWVVDDVAVAASAGWAATGPALLAAIEGRPAVLCAPTSDRAQIAAAAAAGLTEVSSYWIAATRPGGSAVGPIRHPEGLPAAPVHTFGSPLDPFAAGALAFETLDGVVVGSPSIAAPPVYDPGGTVCIVDRVVGAQTRLLRDAMAAAEERGDVVLAVVCGQADVELAGQLSATGFERTVEVLAFPARAPSSATSPAAPVRP
jgi:hypothetical protein